MIEDLDKLSPTKLRIILSLRERRKTLSEISRELDLSKTTIYAHLINLMENGYVRRSGDNHKWIYYELTGKSSLFLKMRGILNQ